jgi:hypothetical protein
VTGRQIPRNVPSAPSVLSAAVTRLTHGISGKMSLSFATAILRTSFQKLKLKYKKAFSNVFSGTCESFYFFLIYNAKIRHASYFTESSLLASISVLHILMTSSARV